ncbi:MAG: hypothetical protein ABSG67_07315 [Thermoguttaceae bacterium]|jgi:hypothetical protein
MHPEDIIAFVKKEIEPLPSNPPYGERYRVAATLTDGTYLPCVVVEDSSHTVDLAIKRFHETRKSSDPYMGYRALVRSFVTGGNTVNDYDLQDLSLSPFAIPLTRVREIGGETSMSWTEFYATMRDGKEFRFGTTFWVEFFNMPDGYTATDIMKIVPAVRNEKPRTDMIYRDKPFFTCYVDGL